MNLIQELKRRNVFRVAVFYAVSSWLILQVADVLFGILRLPDWTLSFVAALLLLGFPLVCVFSWIYEITPDGIKKESEIDRTQSITPETGKRLDRMIIVVLVAVIGVLLVDRFWPSATPEPSASPTDTLAQTPSIGPTADADPAAEGALTPSAAPEAESPTVLSVAVLPFANLSSDAENEYFADGLTEELLNALAQIDALKVAGRTSSFYFKGRNEDLKSIGRQLGVAHVLEGSVRKAGQQVRITAQLIKVDDGFHLWSNTYDRDLADIFQVQEDISGAIAEALKVELGLAEQTQRLVTHNVEAYEKYLEARARIASRNGLDRAIALLQDALALDPEFADAWAQLAQAYSLGHYYDIGTLSENLANALEAADRALVLNADLAPAISARADALRDTYRWQEAETDYRRALALDPDEVEANSQYGQFLMRTGYLDAALEYQARAREVDPLSEVKNVLHGWNLILLGRQSEAQTAVSMGMELAREGSSLANLVGFWHRALQGRLSEAEPLLSERLLGKGASEALVSVASDALRLTSENQADAALARIREFEEMAREEPIWSVWNFAEPLALLASYNGDNELAVRLFLLGGTRTSGERVFFDTIFLWAPDLGPLRQTAEFKDTARQFGLVEFWRQRGWPDLCRPLGDDDFECR